MGKRSRQEATADLTPMIDVVFLLLIFFMTSTVFKKTELALLLNLPKTDSGKKAEENTKALVIELDKDKTAINGKTVDRVALESNLSAITDKDKAIDLRVDKDVKYSRLIEILDLLKKFSLTNLSLITDN